MAYGVSPVDCCTFHFYKNQNPNELGNPRSKKLKHFGYMVHRYTLSRGVSVVLDSCPEPNEEGSVQECFPGSMVEAL